MWLVCEGYGVAMDVADVQAVSDLRGDQSLVATIEVTWREAVRPGSGVALMDANTIVWRGWVTGIQQRSDRLEVYAVGLWSLLGGLRYTAFWSHVGADGWRPIPSGVAGGGPATDWRSEIWETTVEWGRLTAALRQGETYGGQYPDRRNVAFAYRVPHRSETNIAHTSFNYERSSLISAAHNPFDDALAASGATTVLSATSGTMFIAHSAFPAVVLRSFNTYSAPTVYSSPTGTDRIQFWDLRVAAKTPPVTPRDILDHALTSAQARLPQLASWHIPNVTVDVREYVAEDRAITLVITDMLAEMQRDSSTLYTVRCTRQHCVAVTSFNDVSSHRYHAREQELSVTIDSSSLISHAYATYRDPSAPRLLRTTTAATAGAEGVSGARREAVVSYGGTSLSDAHAARDAVLRDAERIQPRGVLRATALFGSTYVTLPHYAAETGDTISVPALGVDLMIVRKTMTRSSTTYELETPDDTLLTAIAT